MILYSETLQIQSHWIKRGKTIPKLYIFHKLLYYVFTTKTGHRLMGVTVLTVLKNAVKTL